MPTWYGKSYTQQVPAQRQYAHYRLHFTAWQDTDIQRQAVRAWTLRFRQASAGMPLRASRKSVLQQGTQGVLIISREENSMALPVLRPSQSSAAQPERLLPSSWEGDPRSDLGKLLKAIQQRAATRGVKLTSNAEILDQLRKGRERGD